MTFTRNVSLRAHSSYKVGGPALFFAPVRTIPEVRAATNEARKRRLSIFILGGGTNLLIPDEGFEGLVLQPRFMALRRSGTTVRVGAGVSVKKLLEFTAREGLSGLEWAGGLPGLVGGAIRGNAGAFKGETKDSIVSVTSFDLLSGKVIRRSRRACRFAYRMSVFKEKEGREVILEAVLKLRRGEPRAIRAAMREKIAYRFAKHPMEYPNIGSIFKNVPVAEIPRSRREELAYNPKLDPFPVIPAARLIGKAGLTGKKKGGAMVSPKHTNFIVNTGGATERDVAWLMDYVKATVREKCGVVLHEEVERLRDKVARLPRLS